MTNMKQAFLQALQQVQDKGSTPEQRSVIFKVAQAAYAHKRGIR